MEERHGLAWRGRRVGCGGLSTAASGALDVLPPVLGMPPVAAAPPVLVMPPVVVVPPVFVVPPVAVVPPAPPAPPLALVSAPVPASTGTFVGASAKAKSTPESCAVPTLASGPMTAPPVFTVPPLPDQAAEVARNCTSCTNANRTVVQIVQNPRRAGRPQVAPTLTPASGRLGARCGLKVRSLPTVLGGTGLGWQVTAESVAMVGAPPVGRCGGISGQVAWGWKR